MPLTDLTYQVICSRSVNKIETELVIMIPISENEEAVLDKGLLVTTRDGFTFTINKSNVICYGEIDFHNNSDDFDIIQGMNWLDHLDALGICVPSDYNYEEHCCYSPINSYRYYDTTNPAVVAQYIHARLGKPQRCCIFKEKINGTHKIA